MNSASNVTPLLPPSSTAGIADWAKRYAAAGFRPIALRQNEKVPIAAGWQTATLEDTLALLADTNGANLGVVVPESMLVLDCDTKSDGPATLAAFELMNGQLPSTLRATTQSGGSHSVLVTPLGATVGNATGFAQGLDIRAAGKGYIVVEPSTIDGRPYKWQNWGDTPASAPEWLLTAIKEGTRNAKDKLKTDPDTPVPEGCRDEYIFGLARSMVQAGAPRDTVMEAVSNANALRCNPPLPKAQVARKVESAFTYTAAPTPWDVFANPGELPLGAISSSSDADWSTPQAIPCSLLPVEPFNDQLLPKALRAWASDIAVRMQCPPDFPAVGAMVAFSSVIGRKACIRPKRHDDWQVVPNLWGAVVGRPGVMKSPALSEVLKPLDRLSTLVGNLHAEAMRDHEIKSKLDKMNGKALEDKAQALVKKGKIDEAKQVLIESNLDAIATPALRRYKVTDASVEALGEILIENPWGTLAYRDELNGLLRSLDKEGQEGARAFYLQGYDGNQGYTFDRIMRGKNLHIPAVCIAMLGGIQPGKLQAYIHDAVSGGAGDDGLLQRFGLLVWPDIGAEWLNIDKWPDTLAKTIAFEAFQRLDTMTLTIDSESGEEAPVVYQFSDDAQTLFEEWRQGFETELRSGEHHPAMESHLSKYRKLVPAIALVCALADGEIVVSKASLQRALAWARYLQTHAARAYAAGSRPATEGAMTLLSKIKKGAVVNGFKPADVYLKGWSSLGKPEDVHAAISMLCDLNHLRRIDGPVSSKGGRPSTTYLINPATCINIL